ncbi:MAG TPA: DNA-directed DNA polymerase II small subunit [Methanothrix sp.]|nr:DNA-directed DNA polymerase II small subunit [Methanothrix sp.]HOK58134.1 DNA-directed DNA polymerase II small subunit [Methanothrix sp.]HOL43038.1 DNA-directed DNA polymerase II small subunit [Methanothrix sp.]HPO88041.1 DNA-directed DNA polymerase II small subunit [Methanothrix sp.]
MLEIVQMFAERGYQLTPEALEILLKKDTGSIDHLISSLDASTVVVSAEHVLSLLDGAGVMAAGNVKSENQMVKESSATSCAPGQRSSSVEVEVLREITGRSTCLGNYSDFVKYFRDRYAKIHDLLSKRMSSRPIETLSAQTAGREVSVIGMIMDIRSTSRARVVELEDPTGMVTVLFSRESPAYEDSMLLVTDEVVGITGTSDGKGRIFAKSIVWPDLQAQPQPLTPASGGALFLSDLHVGSRKFLRDTWNRFVSWISGEDPTGLSSNLGCIVIAGDIVDGIGVYPGQEDELEIKDIYEQYQLAADLISEIPSWIKIVISPGNHDIVRQAEPQPALPKEIQSLFSSNVIFVGNPSWISISSRPVLIYHGRSIDDFVLKVPGLSYREPELAMVEMLRRRHLCPIYGNRVSVAPEVEDHYVIDRPPAILHCGHVHVVGITRYKGVTLINSGTWQGQTEFQKKMNIQPTPGIVPHVDLSTMKVRKLRFT